MRNSLSIFLAMFILLCFVSTQLAAQNKYVGTKMCAPCHRTEKQGKQFEIWQKSMHSQAYKTLTTPKAAEVAKAMGVNTPPSETPECLNCHVTAYKADAKLVDKGFDCKEGVQCETCHGAGSAFKNLTVMKDHAKSVAAGMREFKDATAIEAFCKTCHNEKSPSYKEFKFEEMWGKIKHLVPKAG